MSLPRIGITLGDVTGIGPEVTLKALATEVPRGEARYVVIGDAGCVKELAPLYAPAISFEDFVPDKEPGSLSLYQPLPALSK